MFKGVVIGGTVQSVLVRQKSDAVLEVGEVVIIDSENRKIIAQVVDLDYGSSLTQRTLEMVSGIQLEEDLDIELAEPHLRYYTVAKLKPLVAVQDNQVTNVKTLPPFFAPVRAVHKSDLQFLEKPENALELGALRSGSKALDVPVLCDGTKMLSHHVLIAATTGRGKSNLMSCLLWELASADFGGVLVLDPHDEYYGRDKMGLKNHPEAYKKVLYYTSGIIPPGSRSLRIALNQLRPSHFEGCLPWTDAQREALAGFYRRYKEEWVIAILEDRPLEGFHEYTVGVLKRRMRRVLSVQHTENGIDFGGVFHPDAGHTTIQDIIRELESGHIVVVDTSDFQSTTEVLIGTILTHELFRKYRTYKLKGQSKGKPVVSIVLEEAPRVLGKQVLERGPNVFSTIAREGRKFKVGLVAITQLPSLIPRDILANMNTKIILGLEMKPERQAIIESAAQDLSSDEQHIAGLDTGEALVTSQFLQFATPVKIPKFETLATLKKKEQMKVDVSGLGIGI